MGKRIADGERIERIRKWARQSSARRRVKLSMAGKMQLLCWIPGDLRAQLDATAAQRNQNLSEVTTALLSAALQAAANPAPADRDQQILTLHRQGLSGYAIAATAGCSEPTVRRALKRLKVEATE